MRRRECLYPHARTPRRRLQDKKQQGRLAKDALGQFRNLLGWLGLKKATYADALAEEFLRYGGDTPHMRGELYVMLMKQLTAATNGPTEQAQQPPPPFVHSSCLSGPAAGRAPLRVVWPLL